jgi:hypothetical protein
MKAIDRPWREQLTAMPRSVLVPRQRYERVVQAVREAPAGAEQEPCRC